MRDDQSQPVSPGGANTGSWPFQDNIETLQRMRDQARGGGGPKRVADQHGRGKLTARERVHLLFDEGTFEEFDTLKVCRGGSPGGGGEFLSDGVITGHGAIHGREVFVFSQDFTLMGGSLGEAHSEKISKVMDHAVRVGAPFIGLNDSGGARIQEGVDALAAYGEIFKRNVMASGIIPQISCIIGKCSFGNGFGFDFALRLTLQDNSTKPLRGKAANRPPGPPPRS